MPHRKVLDDDAFGDIYAALDAFGLQLPKEYRWLILKAVSRENKHNPLLDYIDGLKWDGKVRLDDLLVRHFDAMDTEYVRGVTAAWFIGAVRRLRRAGCQMDYALLLDGNEGLLKSTFFRIMGTTCTSPTTCRWEQTEKLSSSRPGGSRSRSYPRWRRSTRKRTRRRKRS